MAAPAAVNTNYVSHDGFDVEHVDFIDLSVKKFVHDTEKFWGQFYDTTPFKKGYTVFKHRKTIRPEVTSKFASSLKLAEGIGAKDTDIKVVETSNSFSDYGTYINYTKEAIRDNIDDVSGFMVDKLKYLAAEVPEALRADTMCTSNFQITASVANASAEKGRIIKYPITDTLDRIKVVLKKKRCKPTKDGKFVAILTPELMTQLKTELREQGISVLDETTKAELTREGQVFNYDGFYLTDRSDEAMYAKTSDTINGDKLVVICRTRDNELPGIEMPGEISIFDNGLGTGLIAKSATDGTLVPDTNHRVGSIAMNIDHLGLGIQADLGHLVCTFSHVDYDKTGVTYPTADPVNGATGQALPSGASAKSF